MRRPILVLAMAIVFVLAMASSALAGPKSDHGPFAPGKGVQVHCAAANFGELVKAAVEADAHDNFKGGAKAFMAAMAELALSADPDDNAIAAAHGCFVTD